MRRAIIIAGVAGIQHGTTPVSLQLHNQAGELVGQLPTGDTLAVLRFHFRSEITAQGTKATAPVLFRLSALIEGCLSLLLTAFN
ncbi:hypothetical protein D3C71_1600900 [compost metagenome]